MEGWREFNIILFDNEYYFQDTSDPCRLYGPVTQEDAAEILEKVLLGQLVDYIELPPMAFFDFEDASKAKGVRRAPKIS
jgi:hypothetical protein